MSTHTQKFNVGDKIRYAKNPDSETYTVVVAEPDSRGFFVFVTSSDCRYYVGDPQYYELAPKRYVVEVRTPKAGERYIYGQFIGTSTSAHVAAMPVIVEES